MPEEASQDRGGVGQGNVLREGRELRDGREHGVNGGSVLDVPEAALLAARSADAKLGSRTVVLQMAGLLGITDAFVLTSAGNHRQVKAIVEAVEATIKKELGLAPLRIEGLGDLQWVLMDYGDVVVHVFVDETREFYDLERLWGDAPRASWRSQTDAAVAVLDPAVTVADATVNTV